jgi:hypothetical protein
MKYCQGPQCHTYFTKDRLRGLKGNKVNQTRRRNSLMWDEFCSNGCLYDWVNKHITPAINYFGRLHKPKHLTKECAWVKRRRWNYDNNTNGDSEFYCYNLVTFTEQNISSDQFYDDNYDLNI